ncbi:MAG: class I SAM-dependent methyltransferase, partial [Polyangiaceae bacterium]
AQERGHKVLGVDFSQAAADACARRGIPARAVDVLTHDFAGDAPFDLITLWDVCEHLDHPFELLARTRSLLAPGGLLVLKVPCFPPRAIRIATTVPRLAGGLLGSPSHIQYFRPQTLTTLLRRAGFPLIQAEPLPPMRSDRPRSSPVALAKRRLLRTLTRLSGASNTLVRARV